MKSLRLKLFSIIALAVAFVACVGAFFGFNFANADRNVTVSGSSIFYTTGNAEVWAHEVAAEEGVEDSTSTYYSMFVLKSDGDGVNYRKNLAHHWFYNANFKYEDENDKDKDNDEGNEEVKVLEKAEGFFNMDIGFELEDGKLAFKKYVITFESQQFSQTKDSKSKNYIIFYPTASGTGLNVVIGNYAEAQLPENPVEIGYDNISIKFSKSEVGGNYNVTVSTSETAKVEGEFENIGGNYARYSSSSTTPVTPLSFKAEFEEGVTANAKMVMYNLNGQSFLLTGTRESDGHRVGGTVNDTTPPVLCLDKGVSFIQLGGEISFRYTVVDVLASSPSITTSYFMLTKNQVKDGVNAEDYTNESLFRKVADSDDQKMIPHATHYIPNSNDFGADSSFGDQLEAKAAVKVCLKLTDTSSSGGVSDYVMLDWFVEDEFILNIDSQNYIAVAEDTVGTTYAYTDGTASNPDSEEWDNLVKEYQAAVDEAAKDLLAGSKNYFYLPSAEKLFKDNATRYADMTFAIYYNNGSQQQQSNKAANALSINISKAGRYMFTIFANDSVANPMYYYDAENEKKEFTTNDIWNMYEEKKDSDFENTRRYLPWFYFDVEASEISIETPEEQDTAYVGSSYTPESFDINGVSYNTEYNLYLFNNDKYFEDKGVALTYEQFLEQKDELLNDDVNRKWFTYIYSSSELNEGTEEYEKYNEYAWNSSSLTFVPQDENAFYLIQCVVKSTTGSAQEATAYMAIASAPQVKPLTGEDTWVRDNMISIVLLSIAGVSLIGIVLLIVIKPKDKGDLDDMELEKPKK